MAVIMSIVFCVPTFYLCSVGGSFFVWWLVYLVSLCDGICARIRPSACVAAHCHPAAGYWAALQEVPRHACLVALARLTKT